MSFYNAYVGEVVIKPECRKDFGHLFRCEYGSIESNLLNVFLNKYFSYGKELRLWKQVGDRVFPTYYGFEELTGWFRYQTTYKTGEDIRELLYRVIPEIAQEIVYSDCARDRFFFYDSGLAFIKPEFRKDLKRLLDGEYEDVEAGLMRDFLDRQLSGKKELCLYEDCGEGYQTSYDEATGAFHYGVTYEKGNDIDVLFREILPNIAFFDFGEETKNKWEKVENKYDFHVNGDAVIVDRDGLREDFGHLFRWEYYKIKDKALRDWANPESDVKHGFIELYRWDHHNAKKAWEGKYKTSYDEESGLFVYGVYYNDSSHPYVMDDFFEDILPEFTETVISQDYWNEYMEEDE